MTSLIIYNPYVTSAFIREIGEVTSIRLLADGDKCRYLVNNKWHIAVDVQSNIETPSYSITKYHSSNEKEKKFGHKVFFLMKQCDVPWEIAKIVAEMPDIEIAKNILSTIKTCRDNCTDTLRRQLLSPTKASNTIQTILIEYWKDFEPHCRSRKRIQYVGKYISGVPI